MLLRILRPSFQFGSLSTTIASKFYQTGTPVGDIIAWLATFAIGGDYGGAATYIAEHSPQGKRGLYTSSIQTTATLGLFMSLGVILITRSDLGNDAFAAFGWRIPFLVSIFLVAISLYIRISLRESPRFQRLKDTKNISKNPIRESFGNPYNLRWVLLALFGATMGQGVVWYTGDTPHALKHGGFFGHPGVRGTRSACGVATTPLRP